MADPRNPFTPSGYLEGQRQVKLVLSRTQHIDVLARDPVVSLAQIVQACEEADEDTLGLVGVIYVAALLDLHWEQIGEAFAEAMVTSRPLRLAYVGTYLDIPDELERRLDALLQPGEDLDS